VISILIVLFFMIGCYANYAILKRKEKFTKLVSFFAPSTGGVFIIFIFIIYLYIYIFIFYFIYTLNWYWYWYWVDIDLISYE
jgi:hypothetical protein